MPVERGVGARDDRPRVRVGGRFAGEVAGIELLEGGVDVVEVERDARRDPVRRRRSRRCRASRRRTRSGRWSRPEMRTRLRARRSPRVAMTVDVMFAAPTSATARMFAICDISTVSDPGVHDPTTIVGQNVVGQ